MRSSAGEKWSRKNEWGSHRSRLSVDSMKRPWTVFQSTWSNTPRSSAVEWNAQCLMSDSEPNMAMYTRTMASATRPSCRSSHVQKLARATSGEFLTAVAGCTALFSRSETLSFGGPSLISTAARDRVKLAIDQCEEQFHVYDDKSSEDTLDSYEAALNRGKAMGFQEAAHYVKSALHDIDVKSL